MIKVACEPSTRMELTASPTFTSRERTNPSIGLTIVELRRSSCAFSSEALACATWASHLAISALETASVRCALTCLFGPLHVEFEERHIRAFRVDLVALQCGFGRIQRRFGGLQVCAGGAFGGFELHLVELRKQLPLLHPFTIINVKLFHDAAGFGFDPRFGERLNLAGGHNHTRQVTALHGSNL